MSREEVLKIFSQESPEEINFELLDEVFFSNQMKDSQGNLKIKWSKVSNNKLIEIRKMFRGYHFPEHTHDYIEVIYVIKGQITQRILGRELSLNEGHLLFLNPNISHEIFPANSSDIAAKIFLNKELFRSIFEFICINDSLNNFFLETIFDMSSEKAMLFDVSGISNIESLIYEIILDSLEISNPFSNQKLKLKISLLITELASISNKMIEIKKDSYDESILYQVLSYIEVSYQNGKLEEISQTLNTTNYFISKLIKSSLKTTFKNLIHKKRLEKSLELLLNSTYSITEISEYIGYKNWSFFYDLFKKEYLITPNEYRKRNKKPLQK